MKIAAVVEAFWDELQRGIHCPREWRGRLTLHQAYEVQLGLLGRHVARGEIHAGWKVGLTGQAMQRQQGVHEPVFGFLLESGAHPSGAAFRFDRLIDPGFENELCLTVGTPLRGPDVTPEEARAAVVAVAPALEIIERRSGEFGSDLPLSIADNAQQRAFVTGPVTRPLSDEADLAATTVEVVVNGVTEERAGATPDIPDPILAVAWLADKLATFGLRIEAGARIMSGSLTRQYRLTKADRVEARFDPWGTVAASFE